MCYVHEKPCESHGRVMSIVAAGEDFAWAARRSRADPLGLMNFELPYLSNHAMRANQQSQNKKVFSISHILKNKDNSNLSE